MGTFRWSEERVLKLVFELQMTFPDVLAPKRSQYVFISIVSQAILHNFSISHQSEVRGAVELHWDMCKSAKLLVWDFVQTAAQRMTTAVV